MTEPEVVVGGLAFGEGPRWHDGRVWFSDMHDHAVKTFDPATSRLERIVEVEGSPSGLGWDRDGRLVVVSMDDRRLLRFDGDTLSEIADLSQYTPHPINDMVVSATGVAYIGSFGFDLHAGEQPTTTVVLAVDLASGVHRVAADELRFPNGMVITTDDSTLIVAESFGGCLTAFTIADAGALTDRREWAALEGGAMPDGICLDAEGCVWVSSPATREFLRVKAGGSVLERVSASDRLAIACMLGDDDRRSLYLLTSKGLDPSKAAELRTGRLERVRVAVPGAGRP
ncbi:MAG TPA: SMP-30/gluconolactonase/LRE family protein [Acidimicrobiales bacterium]|nr:SMP-30/gluconolactonase/LRE family protein [Acidimicrobiales bacterium]